ncbi:MAG: 6-phosphogluconolactonase [Ketobacteraceae bacterium]|nr:6-phosphogluconolactonase [Ketobacteraceae bacterium]
MLPEFKDKVQLTVADDQNALIEAVVAQIESAASHATKLRGAFTMAVSGGSSPRPLLESLAQQSGIPWEQGLVSLVDERYVPADSPDSNENLVRQCLLTHQAADTRFIGLYSDTRTIDQQLAELNTNSDLNLIDIAVLGMGMDGHTASLFPCSPEFTHNLTTEQRYVKATPQTAPHPRISLSATALAHVTELVLFIPGKKKLDRLQQILEGEDLLSPVKTLLTQRQLPLKVFSAP